MAEALAVFISSTYLDNAERRRRVEEAVVHAGMLPVGMERFVATTAPTVAECQRLARECDLYVGIVAHRYGWIPEGHDLSITELEYDAAKAAGRDRLMFEIDPEVPIHQNQDFDVGRDRWEKQQKLEAFGAKYRADPMPGLFTDTTLQGRVLHALSEWRSKLERGAAPEPAAADRTGEIGRYCELAERLHATLELAGFRSRLRVPIALDELYVPLNAMMDLRAVDDVGFGDASQAARRLHEAGAARDIPLVEGFREARSRGRRGLVILGDPGSGKTTHLKRLLLWCLRNGAVGLGLEAEVLPVFLPLRRLQEATSGLDAFIDRELDRADLGMGAGFGAHLRARGHLLLLFDGLDEVADATQRGQVARRIEEVTAAWPTCTPVVTCRFAGYAGAARLGPEFLELHVRPLGPEQAEAFVRNWYRLVETALDPLQGAVRAAERAEELVTRLRETDPRSRRLLEMTGNPLLLANLCLVHRDRGALPRGRARLYDECIDVLLERWREGKGLRVDVGADVGRRVLQPAALWLHGEEQRTRATADELARVLEPALASGRWTGGGARQFLRTVRDESGLLTGWGQDQFGFMHLGFQEYLAAREIRRRHLEGDPGPLRELAARYGESWWQEVILILMSLGDPSLFTPFLAEVVEQGAFAEHAELLNLILEEAAEVSEAPFVTLLERRPGKSVNLWQRHLTALRALERLGCEEALERLAPALAHHPSSEVRRWFRDRAAASTRAAVGQVIVTEHGGVALVRIPGGTFLMGSPPSEKGRYEDEGPQRQVTVREFWLGRYPVTNEEYGRFLAAHPEVPEPTYWRDRRFNGPRQPVVGVHWEEARLFAAWAEARLPTEAEWEYAARAGTTVPYLIGASETDLDQVGWYGGNSGGQPHPVGEKAANAWGLHDVLGNVWEWMEDTWHHSYEGAPVDGSAWFDEGGVNRVFRGGSWFSVPQHARVAGRARFEPSYRNDNLGFRLARSLPSAV